MQNIEHYQVVVNSQKSLEKSHILELLKNRKDSVLKNVRSPTLYNKCPREVNKMSKFNNRKIIPRYSAIAIVMSLIALAVLGKTIYTMTASRSYWMEVASTQKKDSVRVKTYKR